VNGTPSCRAPARGLRGRPDRRRSRQALLEICSAVEIALLTGVPEEVGRELIGEDTELRKRDDTLDLVLKAKEHLTDNPAVPEAKRWRTAVKDAEDASRKAERASSPASWRSPPTARCPAPPPWRAGSAGGPWGRGPG
jgi:hypothetical protein